MLASSRRRRPKIPRRKKNIEMEKPEMKKSHQRK
jgi:hypothetical protein